MNDFPRPIIVTSQCLGFSACRYDGQMLRDDFVGRLQRYATLVPVCPEIEIGLGVPRDPIRLVDTRGEFRLIQPSTGRDLTAAMNEFAARYASTLKAVDGFILKSRSPSCGIGDTKVFDDPGSEEIVTSGDGVFSNAMMEKLESVVFETEARLEAPDKRHAFLVEVFASALRRCGCEAPASRPYPDELSTP